MADRHPATAGLLRWFEYDHLPPHLQAVSKPVGDLAHELVAILPDGPELSTGLRKLLEAKDCLVRAALDVPPEQLVSSRERVAFDGHARQCFDADGFVPGRRRECVLLKGHDGEHSDGAVRW